MTNNKLRKRATAVIYRYGKVLLVKERRSREYSLPGGGLERSDIPDDPHNDYNGSCHACWAYAHDSTNAARPCSKHSKPSSRLAIIREVKEEVGLVAKRTKFLFHHDSYTQRHSVYLITDFKGDIKLQRNELTDFVWWDKQSSVILRNSTRDILERYADSE